MDVGVPLGTSWGTQRATHDEVRWRDHLSRPLGTTDPGGPASITQGLARTRPMVDRNVAIHDHPDFS